MGTAKWVVAPLALLFLLQLAGASHDVRRSLEAEAASPSVPASILSPLLRTGYHFQPPMNWINDPNGPLYYKGWYHLFYQYNPNGAVWGNIIWAHSVSRDLINWMALEPAIKPSIPTDQYGVWSGSATILPDGTPAMLYTGIDRPGTNYQIQNIALPKDPSDPLLREWVKPGYNPIAVPVDGMNATQFRDPTTAWQAGDGLWRMLVGGLKPGTLRGMAILYRSRDFKHWVRAKHPLHSALTGMWECPDFFPVREPGLNHDPPEREGRKGGEGDTAAGGEAMATTTATCLLAAWSLVAAGLFGTGLARASFAPAAVGKEQREFDYFALALQWPGTICSSTRHCCAVNGCCRKEPLHTFTIHGLWPDYDDGTWPSCCRHTSFDMDKITPLKPTLDKYWPSLYCSSSSTCFSGRGPFWAHEWEKHGTCSAPAVQEELQYFTTALDLYFKHNVTEMLATGDILVSNDKEYALSDVIDTIKHAFGGSPQIICKKGSVEELRLCFTKDLKPRDCLTTSAMYKNLSKSKHCPKKISLPTYDPIVLANSTLEIVPEASDNGMYFYTS